VRRTLPSWIRTVSAGLVFVLGLTFSAIPAAAGTPPAATAKPTLAAAAAAKVAAVPISKRALAQTAPAPAPAPSEEHRGFFKTPAGVAAIVLMVAGTGWMVYSAYHDNDPVHSPFRD
jgi:hypothetical protein